MYTDDSFLREVNKQGLEREEKDSVASVHVFLL